MVLQKYVLAKCLWAGRRIFCIKWCIHGNSSINSIVYCIQIQLEQVEPLRSEDTPRHLMITHAIESYWIPSQKKTKSKLQI